jgi:hypothetical protein
MQVFYFCSIYATFFMSNDLFLHDFLLKFHAVTSVFKIGYLSLTLQWSGYNFTIMEQNFTKMSTNLLICTFFVNNYTHMYQCIYMYTSKCLYSL